MHTVIVTKTSYEVVEAHANPDQGMVPGIRQPDGAYAVVLDDDVYERLLLIDPNIDLAIQKLVLGQVGKA